MYVAEMRTYMQDVNGTGQYQANSRISMLEDTDHDGKMDKHTVFIDSLVLPRMLLALDGRLVVNETYSNNYYSYQDTNGDGKADEKIVVYQNDTIDTWNLEHQKSGLVWNIDNWIYITSPHRFRFSNGKMKIEAFDEASWPFGQWGLAKDNYGRLFYSMAGGETPALGFQQNPVYGPLNFKDQYDEVFQATWPIIGTPDVEGGLIRLREDSTLNHFTAPCGQSVFRGDRLPDDMPGDLFVCEPVGRLVRRARVINEDGKTFLKNVYHQAEFLASTDMNFRPVNTATGPDGCLYIVDMYHGIIQESHWVKEGSYLRSVILRKGLDKNTGRGRIYRVVHDGYKPGKRPQLLNKSSKQLVKYLAHSNGWWRDQAQKLIVIRGDRSVIPALKKMTLANSSHLGRLHALWTLEGLNIIDEDVLFQSYKDENPEVRKAAIRISEVLLKNNHAQVIGALASLKDDPSANVRIQLALSLRFSQSDRAKNILKDLLTSYADNEILIRSAQKSLDMLAPVKPVAEETVTLSEADKDFVLKGAVIYKELCATCHGQEGKGSSTGGNQMLAPYLSASKRVNGDKDILIRILLDGLSGPVDGKNYPGVMPPMKANDDEWIASVLSYVRNDLGNKATVVYPDDIKKVRKETANREKFWTVEELER